MKKLLLIIVIFNICIFSMASSIESFTMSNSEKVALGDISPKRYNGSTFRDKFFKTRTQLGTFSLIAGIHSGQFLNSSYGKMCENGLIKPKRGFVGGINFYSAFPAIISIEYSEHLDVFGDFTNHNKSLSGFVSLATFPWLGTNTFAIIPNIGIGLRKSKFGPDWELPSWSENEPEDHVIQPAYKLGIIINFAYNGRYGYSHLQIIGNYYRSLFINNQPHAMNAFTIGIGWGM